ncbi:MAG: AraC family transcriptional regulator [Bacteroidota bacterium]
MKLIDFQRSDDKQLLIDIRRLEDQPFPHVNERHRNHFHTLLFIEKGYSKQEVDFEQFELQSGQILIIPAGVTHIIQKHMKLEGYSITFKDAFFSPPQKRLLMGFVQYAVSSRKMLIHIPEEKVLFMKSYCELLFEEQEVKIHQNQIFILQNLILAFLNKLESFIQQDHPSHSFIQFRDLFQKFITLMEENYLREKGVNFYTDILGVSSRNLNDVLKQLTGQTALDLIIERTMLEAKRELTFTSKSIKEIAIGLGYENQYYFSRIFKKRTNQSPESFRQEFAA